MLTVAVTGGIGSGKSTVSRALADLGAVVVDSDRLARQVVAPGTPGLAAVTEEFGPGVLASDGSLDRAALAGIVFADADARHRLEAITHPLVRRAFRQAREAAGPGAIVVNDIPLVRTLDDAAQFHLVITVTSGEGLRVRRLVERGLTEQDARARMRAQISDDDRRPLSDVLIGNDGDEADLWRAVRALWSGRLMPFQDNLLAGRPAVHGGTRGVQGVQGPGDPSPAALLCARVSAAAGGLPCEPVEPADSPGSGGSGGAGDPGEGGVIGLVLRVPDLATADAFAPALAAAGFPRAGAEGVGSRRDGAGGDGAGGDGPPSAPERRHASADPGRAVDLRLRIRTSSSP